MNRINLFLCFILSLTLWSCKDDNAISVPQISDIYGTWQCSAMHAENETGWNIWPYEKTVITFNPDYTMSCSGYFGDTSGLWSSPEKGVLACNLQNGDMLRFRLLDVDEDICQVKLTTLFGTYFLRLSRFTQNTI